MLIMIKLKFIKYIKLDIIFFNLNYYFYLINDKINIY